MKKIAILIAACALVACSQKNTGETAVETEAVTEETTESASSDSFTADFPEIEKSVREFYAGAVFGENTDSAYMAQFCTAEFMRQLSDAYDYDSPGYATCLLRSGMQDGDDSPGEVLSVTPGAGNTVVVEYSDMGHKGSTTLEMAEDSGRWKINACTVPEGFDTL